MIANTNSVVQHVIQIKSGIMINVDVSVKSMTRARKIIIVILAQAFVRIIDI